MNLGIFPEVCIIAWVACFPPMVWDFLFGRNWMKKIKFSISHRVGAFIEKLKEKHFISNKYVHTYDGGMPAMVIVTFFMVLVFWWNWMRVEKVEMPQTLKQIVRVTRVNQKWGMFAPNPSRSDGWYVIHGRLSNGSQVDLLSGEPLTGCIKTVDLKKDDSCTDCKKPKYVSSAYSNHRWRKYFNNFHRKSKSKFRKHYGRYLANKWKDKLEGTDVKLMTFEIFFIEEKTGPDYTVEYVKKHSLWKHWTDKEYKKYFYPNGDPDEKKENKSNKKKSNKKPPPPKDARGVIQDFTPGGQEKIGNSDDAPLGGGGKEKPKTNPKDKEPNLDGE